MKTRLSYLVKTIGLIYLLYFICRLAFFVFQYEKFHENTWHTIIKAFVVGTLFDTVSICYSNSLFIVLILVPITPLQTWKLPLRIWFVASNSIPIALNLIDMVYFDYAQRRTGDEIFVLGHNTGDLLGTYIQDFWHVILLFIAFVVLMAGALFKIQVPTPSIPSSIKQWSIAILIFLSSLGVCFLGMRGGLFRTPLLTQDAAKFVDGRLVALATNTLHQIISTVQSENISPQKFLDDHRAEQIFSPYQHYPQLRLNKKNVVIIILESFDKEYIGYYNKGKGFTPFLDSLIEQSISFKDSYANGTQSIECPSALFSSLPSLMNDSYINSQYNTNKLSGLGEILSKEGYSTAFYHGGENGTMNFDAFIGITNFGKYYGLMQYPWPQHSDGHWGIPDEPYLQYFAQALDKTPQPFCQAVFTLSSHHPYLVPEPYKNTLPKGSMPIHQAVAYSDLALRKFFETAKKLRWYDNTIFVITADHTSITDNPYYLSYFGDYCVPIIFHGKDLAPSEVKTQVIQHKEVMPSLLYLLGYNKPFFTLGRNAFDEKTNTFSITHRNGIYTYITGQLFFETNLAAAPKGHHLQTQQALSPHVLDSLDTELKAYLQTYQTRMVENKLY